MAKRELTEINAGSMADIAFLLLIFFLVTTTMAQDFGIMRQLPPMQEDDVIEEPETVKEKNVFRVLVNSNDQLLVESEFIQIDQLKDKTLEFLTNKGVFKDEPGVDTHTEREWVRKSDIVQKIANAKGYLAKDQEDQNAKNNLKKYSAKLDAINFFGEYKALIPAALISLKNDNGTSYDMYIQIQNELTSALNELRDELVSKVSRKTYLELDKLNPEERRIIMAVRQIYPQKVSEAEPNQ